MGFEGNASDGLAIRKVTAVMNGIEYEKVWLEGYCGDGETVHVPEGVTHIDKGVFAKKDKLISVHFPSTVKEARPPFTECPNVAYVYFHGTEKIKLAHGFFEGASSQISVVFEGSSETFLQCIEPYTESEGYYHGGQNGGAPGLYLTYYRNTPLAHPLGDEFSILVKCLADDTTRELRGMRVESRYMGQSSPYGN